MKGRIILIEDEYRKYNKKLKYKIAIIMLVTLFIALFCLVFGTDLEFLSAIEAIGRYVVANEFTGDNIAAEKVIVLLRLPRICLAILSGMGLAIAGLMMQAVTRNFLVSPFTLGVSSAAAFGASLCIVFGSSTIFFDDIFIIGSAFISAKLSMVVVFCVAKRVGITANSVILIGIALNYFFAALTASLQFFAQENKLAAVVQWTFGTFNRANWEAVGIIGIVLLICCLFSIRLLLKWNVMASGDDELVKSLGINPENLRGITMFVAVLITATIISFTGVIGFVGLIAPHMARFIVGDNYKFLFLMTAAVGACLLLLSDTFGKFILYPVNVPVGIVVSFIGVPIFIHLILSSKKGQL